VTDSQFDRVCGLLFLILSHLSHGFWVYAWAVMALGSMVIAWFEWRWERRDAERSA